MKTPESKTARVGAAPRVTALRSVGTESAPLRLKLAQQVEDLERKLASSQHESIAALQQLAAMTKANAQLRRLIVRQEHEVACDRPPTDLSRKFTDSRLCAGLDLEAARHFGRLLAARSRYRKGDGLYHAGEGFKTLYAISAGSCKTVLLSKDGQAQVTGYHLAGEIVGFDGIDAETYECQAIALEDMEVFPLPFDELENLARLNGSFGHTLHIWLSHEGARTRALTMVLGTMRAEQRLAAFLLDRRIGIETVDIHRASRAADDAPRDWKLLGASAGNREPSTIPISERWPDPGGGSRRQAPRPSIAARAR